MLPNTPMPTTTATLVARRSVNYERECPTCGAINVISFADGIKHIKPCKHFVGMAPLEIWPNSDEPVSIVFGKE